MRGVLHLHSRFSDGEETVEHVAGTFKQQGMDFIAMSDHAEVFNENRMREYVDLCASLSSDDFLVIPGLEFAFKGGSIHILGYGIPNRVRSFTMEHLVDGIHDAGGIAVLAHPPFGSINMIDAIKNKLDGIEVWNGRYDGTVAPRVETFQLLRRIRMSNLKAAAFGGVDLHQIEQARRPVWIEVIADSLERDVIIESLRSGLFSVRGRRLTIPARGKLTLGQELSIAIRQPFCLPRAG